MTVRVRFLRRLPHSSISVLTAHDISPEPFPELQEQFAALVGCVWDCERRARQEDRVMQSIGSRHRCQLPGINDEVALGDIAYHCKCGLNWVWVWRMNAWMPWAATE